MPGPHRLVAAIFAVMHGAGLATTAAPGEPPGRGPRYRRRRPEDTTLHALLRTHAPAFFERAEAGGMAIPGFVKAEFDATLACGRPEHGIVRLRCASCGHDEVVAFSCKCRGFCPSCGTRRMEASAAHLVDRVLPRVPVRQFVLTLPIPLRLLLAARPGLIGPVLGVVHRLLARHLAALAGLRGALCATGAVTIIQRFGSAANLNVHFHCLALDGVYRVGKDGRPRFVAATAPTQNQVQALLAAMIARLMRLFVRRGVVVAEADRAWVEDAPDRADDRDMAAADGPSALPILHLASTTYRIATGPHAGRRIATIGGGFHAAGSGKAKRLCAEIGGFSLHAATRCRAGDRFRLTRLCRYVTRPAFADDQLSWDGAARVTFELKTPWRDGTTHLEMTPIDFMERLAALVPRPRLHLIRFHGVLAPNAKLRAMVVPQSPGSACPRHDGRTQRGADAAASAGRADAPALRPGLRWADLMRRVYDIDISTCPNCGQGRLEPIATILDPDAIARILAAMALQPRAPPG